MKTRNFYVFEHKKQKNNLKSLVVNQEAFTFASSNLKTNNLSPTAARKAEDMTKENALEMIESMHGNDTCIYTADAQGNNGWYNRIYVDDLLDRAEFEDESWELAGFSQLTEGDIDVDEFCQEYDEEEIEGVKEGIKNGEYYLATFTNEERGTYEVLVWE